MSKACDYKAALDLVKTDTAIYVRTAEEPITGDMVVHNRTGTVLRLGEGVRERIVAYGDDDLVAVVSIDELTKLVKVNFDS